jgi:NADH dehydrogenase
LSKFKVTIVGGGFGGIKAALELADDTSFDITLISEIDSFRYYPTLYVTATGGKKSISTIPLSRVFANKKIRIITDSVVKINRENNSISTKTGQEIKHDALILALGVKTNYFGIEGLQEFSYGIKSTEDAEKLKRHLHRQIIEERRIDTNYVVVGGGPTGVELAGALPFYINKIARRHGLPERKVHIDLVEASPRVLPRMPKDVSRMTARHLRKIGVKLYLKTAVKAQTADALMVHNKPIRSHTVIWTAGVANHPFFKENDFQLTKTGKVRVDHFLQAEPGIYVIGDNADTPFSGMAQTALYDGQYVAKNIKRIANKEDPVAYHAKKPIYVVPAGPKYAAVVWGKFRIYGLFGWLLRRAADFIAYNDYLPWPVAAELWMAEDDEETSCIRCAAQS